MLEFWAFDVHASSYEGFVGRFFSEGPKSHRNKFKEEYSKDPFCELEPDKARKSASFLLPYEPSSSSGSAARSLLADEGNDKEVGNSTKEKSPGLDLGDEEKRSTSLNEFRDFNLDYHPLFKRTNKTKKTGKRKKSTGKSCNGVEDSTEDLLDDGEEMESSYSEDHNQGGV